MADNRVEIQYRAADVTSTQRERVLRSSQFKLLLFFWGLGVMFVALHVVLPGVFTLIPGATWGMVWQVGLIYVASILLLLFVVPFLNFHFTRFWRLPLVFQWNRKTLRLGIAGKSGGLQLEWSQITKVEVTRRSFVIYYEDNNKHFILPKACFSETAEDRFYAQLERWEDGEAAPVKKLPEVEAAVEEDEHSVEEEK